MPAGVRRPTDHREDVMGQTRDPIGGTSRRVRGPGRRLGAVLALVGGALALGGCIVLPAAPARVAVGLPPAPVPPAPVSVYARQGWGYGYPHWCPRRGPSAPATPDRRRRPASSDSSPASRR